MRSIVLALLLVTATPTLAEGPYVFARGNVTQSDQEADECYVNIGHGPDALMVTAHPANMVCQRFRELAAGKRYGRLVFEVEEVR